MTDLEEIYRYWKDAGNYPYCDAVDRWREMPDTAKKALHKRWEREDSAPRMALEERRLEWE